jgi:probable rRNA maturation factor
MPSSVRVQLGADLGERTVEAADSSTRRMMTRAARATLRHAGVRNAEISITLLDDAGIADMNHEFLAHDGPTDVIAFALYESDEDPVGDIYIGLEQAVRQARVNDVDIGEELVRLAVHGTLHVLGFEHPQGKERLTSEMWQVQETIVAQVLAS